MKRREPASLLLSIVFHVAAGFAIMNAAFHYDFSGDRTVRPPVPTQEKLTYLTVAPGGSAVGSADTSSRPSRAAAPAPRLVAPLRVPTAVEPPAPPTSGSTVGVTGGQGAGASQGVTTGIVPGDPDPRLSSDEHAFLPAPKTHAQRVDSAVHASILAYSDSVARAAAAAGKQPGDWTFEKNGQKWGVDGNKIYLGKFAIPSAVLAALPIHIQGNPGETASDRLSIARRGDIQLHAASAYHDDEFKSAVKRIRERKDKERRDRQSGDDKPVVATTP
jgi:hypothetical protein